MANSVKNLTHFLQKSLIIFKKHQKIKDKENEFDIVSIIRAEEEGDFE